MTMDDEATSPAPSAPARTAAYFDGTSNKRRTVTLRLD